jgi:hypothetical protein
MGDSVETKYYMALTTSNGFAYTYNLVIQELNAFYIVLYTFIAIYGMLSNYIS